MAIYHLKSSGAVLEIERNWLWIKNARGNELQIRSWPCMEVRCRRLPKYDWQLDCVVPFDIQTGMLTEALPLQIPWFPYEQLRATQQGEPVSALPELWPILLQEFEPIRGFFSSIPRGVYEVVRPFYRGQLLFLQLLAETGKTGLLLARKNPVLAWCLAQRERFHGTSEFTLQQLIEKQEVELASVLGFPAQERVCDLLQKVVLKNCSVALLMDSSPRLGEARWQEVLMKLPTINRWVLGFLCSPHLETLCPEVFHQVTLQPERCAPWGSGECLLRAAVSGYETKNGKPPGEQCFTSLEEMFRYGELVTEDMEWVLPDISHILSSFQSAPN